MKVKKDTKRRKTEDSVLGSLDIIIRQEREWRRSKTRGKISSESVTRKKGTDFGRKKRRRFSHHVLFSWIPKFKQPVPEEQLRPRIE